MVARLSIASEDRTEKSNTTNFSSLQAELDINAEEDPMVAANELAELPRPEAESLTRSSDNV